jgi:hypothetical protein
MGIFCFIFLAHLYLASTQTTFTYPHLVSGTVGDIRFDAIDISSTKKIGMGGRCQDATLCTALESPIIQLIDYATRTVLWQKYLTSM